MYVALRDATTHMEALAFALSVKMSFACPKGDSIRLNPIESEEMGGDDQHD